VKLYVVDEHEIFRIGIVACLDQLPDVESVASATSVAIALADPLLAECSVAIVDLGMREGLAFVSHAAGVAGIAVIACVQRGTERVLVDAIDAGAIGFLDRVTLTPSRLADGVRAAAHGTGVLAPELLGALRRGVGGDAVASRVAPSPLNEREMHVLRLVANGRQTREVAAELCYSERTIKNVIHDVVTKLNVRTRSQAVALAVREGLI
jgi:DNA-binding NarL/FixJ family response regulator